MREDIIIIIIIIIFFFAGGEDIIMLRQKQKAVERHDMAMQRLAIPRTNRDNLRIFSK